MTCYTAIPGTWGWRPESDNVTQWWQPFSAWALAMRELGLRPLKAEPFTWSTDLNGIYGWRQWFWWLPGSRRAGATTDWHAGGNALRWYMGFTRFHKCSLIAHSHGGYVALAAIAGGMRVPVLVTVGTPVRADMHALILKALPNIGQWIHFYDNDDFMQMSGGFADGHLGVRRKFLYPGVLNIEHNSGHSGLLSNSACWSLWRQQGWADLIIKQASVPKHDQPSTDQSRPPA